MTEPEPGVASEVSLPDAIIQQVREAPQQLAVPAWVLAVAALLVAIALAFVLWRLARDHR